MGAGRSGSTVLGIAIGNARNAFCAGELDAWFTRRSIPNGTGVELEEFWSRVRRRMSRWLGDELPDYHRSFEHPQGWIRLMGRRRVDRSRYRAANEDLYEAITAESGAQVVIDVSHYPLRRLYLSNTRRVEFFTIFLVRDPASVVTAMRGSNQKKKRTWEAVAYIWVATLLSAVVYTRLPREQRLFLRYEEFIARPEHELQRIAGRLGLDATRIDLEDLRPGPLFQGNRMRTLPSISLDRNAASKADDLRPWGARLAVVPLRRLLGYG
jgi:hypothetical protein